MVTRSGSCPPDPPAAATMQSPYVMRARGLVQLVLSAMLDAQRIKASTLNVRCTHGAATVRGAAQHREAQPQSTHGAASVFRIRRES